MFKEMKSSVGKQAIDQIDQKLCKMIIGYGRNLQRAGINVTSTGEKMLSKSTIMNTMRTRTTLILKQ